MVIARYALARYTDLLVDVSSSKNLEKALACVRVQLYTTLNPSKNKERYKFEYIWVLAGFKTERKCEANVMMWWRYSRNSPILDWQNLEKENTKQAINIVFPSSQSLLLPHGIIITHQLSQFIFFVSCPAGGCYYCYCLVGRVYKRIPQS